MLTELVSFSFPAALLLWQGRDQKYLPTESSFYLGKFGWMVNAVVVGWTAFALIIFSLPVVRPASGGSMSIYRYRAPDLMFKLTCHLRLHTCCPCLYGSPFAIELGFLRKKALSR